MIEYLTQEEKSKRTRNRILGYGVLILVLAGSVFGIYTLNKQDQSLQIDSNIQFEDHKKGAESPTVTLIEYGDFQCPACAASYPMLKQLTSEFPDDLQIVFRHLPLKSIHRNALSSAAAAEAAAQQGKFWEMHDKLYESQTSWSASPSPEGMFTDFAIEIGLDQEQFVRDMNSNTIKNKIENDYQDALALGLNSTPTFFLDGQQIPSPATYAQFRDLIINALDEHAQE